MLTCLVYSQAEEGGQEFKSQEAHEVCREAEEAQVYEVDILGRRGQGRLQGRTDGYQARLDQECQAIKIEHHIIQDEIHQSITIGPLRGWLLKRSHKARQQAFVFGSVKLVSSILGRSSTMRSRLPVTPQGHKRER